MLPALARADGDPASDVLLGQSVFYPYSPPVSSQVQKRLNDEIAAAHRAHYPIKVALIGSQFDLGVIPEMFGHPQEYATFLAQEISFIGKPTLLVVMRAGYGVFGLPHASTVAAASLPKPAGNQPDDLARAAVTAVARLAAAAGHPISASGSAAGSSGSSSAPFIVAGLAVLALASATTVIVVRQRHAGPPARGGSRLTRRS